jgi:hypothetical protein
MVVSDETAVTELMSLQTQAFFPNTGKNTGPQRSATVTSSPPVSTYLTVAFSKKKKKKKKLASLNTIQKDSYVTNFPDILLESLSYSLQGQVFFQ